MRTRTLDKARVEQQNMIISKYDEDENGDNVGVTPWTLMTCWLRLPYFVLALFSVLPFEVNKLRGIYVFLVRMICLIMLAHSLFTLVDEGVNILPVVCVCYASGGGLGLLSLRWRKIHNLIGYNRLLERYAIAHGFFDEWLAASLRRLVVVGLAWMLAVVMIIPLVANRSANEDEEEGVRNSTGPLTISFIFLSGVVSALTYCQLHICAGLELMVDTFCVNFVQSANFQKGVVQWNTMQAVMRRAAETVDVCFLSVQTSVLTATALIAMDVMLGPRIQEDALLCLPSGLLLMFVMHAGQYQAAIVTEKCLRTPAFVNSLPVEGDAMNLERQYVVQFIEQSAAGYYVRGVRLTVCMVFKVAYLCAMGTLGFAMRLSKPAPND
eukprot:CAMPEP_0117553988 /NCGR_PEP_ID=MMETSP0784-20121206/50516_1 /TAXON_ID=39447 /ORGANISM="" /LENGTH=380 /DNA_ID=CAMNT_0005351127 /DNA_START=1 /DNA_END=1143 /DNA_ORIENTATION=+